MSYWSVKSTEVSSNDNGWKSGLQSYLYSFLYTPHLTLYSLYTPHFTLHTLHSTVCILDTLHSTLYTLHSTHSTLYTLHSTLHTLHSSPLIRLRPLLSTLHTSHTTLHTLHNPCMQSRTNKIKLWRYPMGVHTQVFMARDCLKHSNFFKAQESYKAWRTISHLAYRHSFAQAKSNKQTSNK